MSLANTRPRSGQRIANQPAQYVRCAVKSSYVQRVGLCGNRRAGRWRIHCCPGQADRDSNPGACCTLVTRSGSGTYIRCRRGLSPRPTSADAGANLRGRLSLRKHRGPISICGQESGTGNRSCPRAKCCRRPLCRRRSDGVARAAHSMDANENEAERIVEAGKGIRWLNELEYIDGEAMQTFGSRIGSRSSSSTRGK